MSTLMKESAWEQPKNAAQEKEALRHHLLHYPAEAGMPSVERMAEFARQLGDDISERVGAMQRNDGWYVNLPDGRTSRVATFRENPAHNPPDNLYIVYHANGTVDVGHGRFGTEFRMERVTPPKPTETQETGDQEVSVEKKE